MNIEDCEEGMEVRCTKSWDFLGVSKGETSTIKEIIDGQWINFGGHIYYNPEYFEPANEFEVGEDYIHSYFGKVNVRGYRKIDNKPIIETENGTTYVSTIEGLSPRKKKDELEKGDEFINIDNDMVEVISRHEDDFDIKYLGYTKINNLKYIGLWNTGEIKEIIYD